MSIKKYKVRFDEFYACELLKMFLPELCNELKIVDKPDLQSKKFNVEVTSIQDDYQSSINAVIKKRLFSRSENPKLDLYLEQNGVEFKDGEILLTQEKKIDLKNVLTTIIEKKMCKSYINNCDALFFINYCYARKKSKEDIKSIVNSIISIYKSYDNSFKYIFLLYDENNFCYYNLETNMIIYKYIDRKQQMLIRYKYYKELTNE